MDEALDSVRVDMIAALLAVALTPHIRDYLARRDPDVLQQVEQAIQRARGMGPE